MTPSGWSSTVDTWPPRCRPRTSTACAWRCAIAQHVLCLVAKVAQGRRHLKASIQHLSHTAHHMVLAVIVM